METFPKGVVIYCFLFLVLFVVQRSFWLTLMIFPSIRQIFHAHLLVRGLNDILSRLEQVEQRPSRAVPHLGGTSGNESDMGESPRRLRSKKDIQNEKSLGASDVGQFFVTGPTDVATKPGHFFCRICRKDVPVPTHGHHKNLRHFQGSKHVHRDQRLR